MILNAFIFHAPWRLRTWQPSRTLGHAAGSSWLELQMVPEPNCFGTDDAEGIIGDSLSKTTTLSQKSRTTFTLPSFEVRPNRRSLAAEPRCKLQMSVSSRANALFEPSRSGRTFRRSSLPLRMSISSRQNWYFHEIRKCALRSTSRSPCQSQNWTSSKWWG